MKMQIPETTSLDDSKLGTVPTANAQKRHGYEHRAEMTDMAPEENWATTTVVMGAAVVGPEKIRTRSYS
jgi:hypothetical protein